MKGTVKTLRFFAWPLAQMLGIATLFYFGTLVLGGLTKMVIFSDYAISFCFLYGIFLYISFWQFSAAYKASAGPFWCFGWWAVCLPRLLPCWRPSFRCGCR